MTIAEFISMPLYSKVSLLAPYNTIVKEAYIIKKIGEVAYIYNPENTSGLGHVGFQYLVLESIYKPPTTKPPYDINTLPQFSTVRAVFSPQYSKQGIVLSKVPGAVQVLFDDGELTWVNFSIIEFIGLPNSISEGEGGGDYPDAMDEPGPKTSSLLIAAGLIFVTLIWT
jgi:hypothetical protein